MTSQVRSVLKSRFENGDKPQGSDYADLIDSFLSLSDATAQSMTSSLELPALTVATSVSANSIDAATATFNNVTASAAVFRSLVASAASVSGNVAIQGNLTIGGTIEVGSLAAGEISIDATAAVSASATFVKLLAAATAFPTLLTQFENTAGSLKYIGGTTKNFSAVATISLAASAANTETFLAFAVDGSALARTSRRQLVTTTNMEVTLASLIRLAQNQRVEVMLRGSAAAADGWIVKDFGLVVKE